MAAAGAPAAVPTDLIGTWQFEGTPIVYAMNSKGRLRFDVGPGQRCLGTFEAVGGTLKVTYDPGQMGCVDNAAPYEIKDDGNTFSFLSGAYQRVDAKDDTSF